MADSGKPEAFVSLATNDFYATGALTLGKSIRDTGTTRKLALVITSGVSEQMRQTLSRIWDELILVEEMNSGDEESLAVLCRPELGVTFTKVAVWTLTQYSKCVFLDADTLVLQNVDELFLREELSAAPDVGWPDCFNSGVFVFRPSQDTFTSLIAFAQEMGSFDGGDQGLLNLYWGNWSKGDIKFHLPFIYNMTANCSYGYAPALLRFKDDIKIVHFIGPVKPWQHTYLSELDTVIPMPGTYSSQCGIQGFLLSWWRVYSSLLSSGSERQARSSTSQSSSHSPYQPLPAPLPPPSSSTFSPPYQDGHSSFSSSYRTPSLVPSVGYYSAHAQYSSYDDESSSLSAPQYTVSSSNSVLNGYRHSITPLDSVSRLWSYRPQYLLLTTSSGSDSSQQASFRSAASSSSEHPSSLSAASSPYPVSIISYEDVHSHISLSFYATSVFDQVSSLVDTEHRAYYVEDLRSEEEEEERTGTKHFSDSQASSSRVSLPTFITPSSSAIFKHLPFPQQVDFSSEGYRHFDPPSSNFYKSNTNSSSDSLSYTEYDVPNEMPMARNNVASPTFLLTTPALGGSAEGVGGDKAWSDSVQPYNCPSLSPPLSPSRSSPSASSASTFSIPLLKDMEPSTLTSITKSQAGSRQSQGRDAKFSHRRDFELGHIDYHGRDSFENILAQISQQVGDLLESETSDPQRSGSLGSLKSRSGSSSKSGSARSSRSKSAGSLSKAEKSSESQEELGSLAHEEGQTQEVSGQELVQEMQEDQMQEMSQTSQPQSQEDLQQGNKEEEFSDSGVRSKPPVPIEAWTMDTQEHTQQEESTKKTCTTDASTSCETVQTVDTASQSVASVCPAVDTTVRSTSPSEPVDQQDHVPVSQALQATGTQEATQKAAITTTPPGTRKGSSVPAAKKKDPTSFVNVKVSPPRVRKGSGLPDVAKKDPTSFVTVNASPPKVRKGSGIPEVAKKDPTSFVTVNASPPGVRKGSGLPEVAKKSPTSFVTVNTSPPGVRKGSSSSPPAVLKKDSTQFVQVSAQGNTTIYGPRKPVAIPDRPPFRLAGTHVAKKSPTTKANPPKSKK